MCTFSILYLSNCFSNFFHLLLVSLSFFSNAMYCCRTESFLRSCALSRGILVCRIGSSYTISQNNPWHRANKRFKRQISKMQPMNKLLHVPNTKDISSLRFCIGRGSTLLTSPKVMPNCFKKLLWRYINTELKISFAVQRSS